MTLEGLASMITAIATPIVLVYLGHLNKKVNHAAKVADEINHAVNGKEEGAQSLVSQVDDIHKVTTPRGMGGQTMAESQQEMAEDQQAMVSTLVEEQETLVEQVDDLHKGTAPPEPPSVT